MTVNKKTEAKEESAEQEICLILKKTDAITFGTYKLSSGRITPYYVDLRVILSFPDAFKKISDILVKTIEKELGTKKFNRVSGIPATGTAFASVIAFQLGKPFIFTRQKVRLHGRERKVEGILMPGDQVLMIDDLVTTGLSLKRAASAIRAEGGVVTDAFVILDREEGGEERLKQTGVNLHSVVKITSAAKKLIEMNAIDEDQLKTVLKQAHRK